MRLKDNFKTTLKIINQNRIRSFLTMLGIIIGIAGVIVIISAGTGAQSVIINQVKSQGSNLISIFPGSADEEGPPASVFGIVITTLTYDDIYALKDNPRLPYVENVSPYVQGTDRVTWEGHEADATFVGVSHDLLDIESTNVKSGQFFTEDDERSLQRVAVIGSDIKKDLFGDESPIGKRIKIGKHNFQVVGEMTERGTSGFTNQDKQIYVPVTTAQKLLLGINHVSFARIKIRNEQYIDKSMDEIKEILRERHDINMGEPVDFDVRSQTDALDALLSITDAIKFFLTAIAGISLIVGGIGIMNIMLVAVQERIREIGLRKAVGAKRYQIIMQFLLETILITLLAGIIGISLGVGVSFGVAQIAQYLGFDWNFSVPLYSVILSTGVSGLIGLIFGFIPAQKAGKLNPIEALQYE